MKLLFDASVSPTLVARLADVYAESTHVSAIGLRSADDGAMWDHARVHGFAIVSKDTDFRERSYVEGFPPKIVWLDVENARTSAIEQLLRSERDQMERFHLDVEASLLILSIVGVSGHPAS